MAEKVLAICATMGKGKSTYIINYMNNHPNKQFIYVTPNLTEVDRVLKATEHRFIAPSGKNKLKCLKELLFNGDSVAITHSLFKNFDPDTIALIKSNPIHLVIDETIDCFKKLKVSKQDISVMVEKGMIEVNKLGEGEGAYYKVVYNDERVVVGNEIVSKWQGLAQHQLYAKHIEGRDVYTTDKCEWLISMLPHDIYNAADDVTLLTYNLEHTDMWCYLKFHNIEIEEKGVAGTYPHFYLTPKQKVDGSEYKHLINIVGGGERSRINAIGEKSRVSRRIPLSKSWYLEADKTQKEQVKKNTKNFFTKVANDGKGSSAEYNMVTVYKDGKKTIRHRDAEGYVYEDILTRNLEEVTIHSSILDSPFKTVGKITQKDKRELSREELAKRYCFIPFNIRATNIYSHKRSCAFLVDVYYDTSVQAFFKAYNIELSNDRYALNILIQWLWRSRIRNGQPIDLYIPSARMRKLLMTWLGWDKKDMF